MKRFGMVTILLVVSLLVSCGGNPAPTATAVPQPTTAVATAAPTVATTAVSTATSAPPTATAKPKGPTVGGTLRFAFSQEPDTFDPQISTLAWSIARFMSASLVIKDPSTGNLIPWLAESYQMMENGSWEFKIRKDVKFHDGTPLTAQSFVWTFARALDPKTKSPYRDSLRGLVRAEIIDDYSFRLMMAAPNFLLINALSDPVRFQPLSQAAVEKWGADYGRHPVGAGPFKFKEWVTGQKVVLERNPDFSWAPSFAKGTPPYIQTLEFDILPEYATVLAGLETGELDFYGALQAKDVERIKKTNNFQTVEYVNPGAGNEFCMNVTVPPFDDVKVRQALSYAVDKQTIVKTAALGFGEIMSVHLVSTTFGYWAPPKDFGYAYDLAKAKALMAQAGYTADANGMLTKGGQPFKFTLQVSSSQPAIVNAAQILQQQFKALGADVQIAQLENAVQWSNGQQGKYETAIYSMGYPDDGMLFALFHSAMIGSVNMGQVSDPKLDELLSALLTPNNTADNVKAVEAVERYAMEQAYTIPLYATAGLSALSNRVKGVTWQKEQGAPWLFDAYIED